MNKLEKRYVNESHSNTHILEITDTVKETHRYILIYRTSMIVLIILFIVTIPLAAGLGPVSIPYTKVWSIILSNVPYLKPWITTAQWTGAEQNIVWEIRFPRVLLGGIVGATLATVGVAIQSLVKNPLADPYILGVSSGASVGATLVIIFGAFAILGQYALSIAAFTGALLSVIIVFLIATTGGNLSTVRLLLSGIAVSAILSAFTNLIVMSAPREEGIRDALFWIMGSLTAAKWEYLFIPMIALLSGFIFLFFNAQSLNIFLTGEESALTLGMNTHLFRVTLLILTALLTGVVVAVSGAIGFVGLMIPHIARLLVGADHRRVLPISALLGATFLIWADVVARLLFAPEEVPIGIITSICGGPFFIWLLYHNRYSFGGE